MQFWETCQSKEPAWKTRTAKTVHDFIWWIQLLLHWQTAASAFFSSWENLSSYFCWDVAETAEYFFALSCKASRFQFHNSSLNLFKRSDANYRIHPNVLSLHTSLSNSLADSFSIRDTTAAKTVEIPTLTDSSWHWFISEAAAHAKSKDVYACQWQPAALLQREAWGPLNLSSHGPTTLHRGAPSCSCKLPARLQPNAEFNAPRLHRLQPRAPYRLTGKPGRGPQTLSRAPRMIQVRAGPGKLDWWQQCTVAARSKFVTARTNHAVMTHLDSFLWRNVMFWSPLRKRGVYTCYWSWQLPQTSNSEIINLVLHDVLYVPDARRNLLSVTASANCLRIDSK